MDVLYHLAKLLFEALFLSRWEIPGAYLVLMVLPGVIFV